jgi:prepilin-type N-terminal cleavage/methylation domain-containing protein
MKKALSSIKRQKGFSLIELSIVVFIVSFMFFEAQKELVQEIRQKEYEQTGKQVTAYTQAVAAYMSANTVALRDPAFVGENHVGLGWLQDASCGGTSPTAYLSCGITQIGNGLSPTVTINPGPPYPSAQINFGNAQTDAGANDPLGASRILAEVRNQADVMNVGYIVTQPLVAPSAAVRVNVDLTQAEVFVRADGSTPVTIVNELQANDTITVTTDNWGVIAGDAAGNLNATPASNVGSISVNDVYIRSIGGWASDIYNLALENYTSANEARLMAEEAIRYETLVSNGDTITKPTCPAGMTPQAFISLATGISQLVDARSLTAFETRAVDNGATWTVVLRLLTSDGDWHNIDSTLGYATARVKCSR